MSGLRTSVMTGSASPSRFLILVPETSAGRKSATAAAMMTTSESAAAVSAASRSCRAVSTRHHVDAGRAGDVHVGGKEPDAWHRRPGRPRPGRHPASRRSGCPGTAPGPAASRVPPALMVTVRPARGSSGAAGEPGAAVTEAVGQGHGRVEDRLGFGQAARAGIGAGQPAAGRLQDGDAPAAQGFHVGLGGGVLPHFRVHGRGEEHRPAGHQQGVGEEVVWPGRWPRGPAGPRWPGPRRSGRPHGPAGHG